MPNPKIGPPSRPECVSHVPESVLRALDLSKVLREALTSMKHPAEDGPLIALSMIESYFDTAKRQQCRIERARASIHRSFRRAKGVTPGRNLFGDVHFYIISWERIYKLAESIRKNTRFSRTGVVLRRYRSDLVSRRKARHHLEHLEERIPGGKYQSKLAVPNDLLNMANQYFTFGGSRLDVGPGSIRLLKEFCDEFFTAVKYDSIEALERKDKRRLLVLITKAGRQVHLARLTRQVKRMLKART